ncbi:DUF3039 domain-containing protein [Falsarthrobacter nasiphocae]|uniref:DUF3039 domain-containing protein n=1 Tax=Falsarthrobacter nasiphocae TaxID=189863 RepID=A0AAE3YIF8_9MICC|nr:DUF3039 domain-containing protein [Falsarthrobacter nasiphocae]MDR6892790.1 hypothetical protein [Falsarthrobacter nasiphocae]
MSIEQDPFESSPLSEPSRGGTSVLERQAERQQAEPGDHERYAHYVQKDRIMESALTGEPVIALCGKVWVPGRDPQKFPVCPDCKKVYDQMQGDGDS